MAKATPPMNSQKRFLPGAPPIQEIKKKKAAMSMAVDRLSLAMIRIGIAVSIENQTNLFLADRCPSNV